MPSNRIVVSAAVDRISQRQTGGIVILGGLLAIVTTALTYSPYVGPFARPRTGPLPDLLPVVVLQVCAGVLLAVGCVALPSTVDDTRNGIVGRYLTAAAFVVVALFPLPAWVAVNTPSFGGALLLTAIGYLGVGGLTVGTVLLARRLRNAELLSRATAVVFALSLPLGVTGYVLLGWFVSGNIPTSIFGPTLFLAPLGLTWIVVGYRLRAH